MTLPVVYLPQAQDDVDVPREFFEGFAMLAGTVTITLAFFAPTVKTATVPPPVILAGIDLLASAFDSLPAPVLQLLGPMANRLFTLRLGLLRWQADRAIRALKLQLLKHPCQRPDYWDPVLLPRGQRRV